MIEYCNLSQRLQLASFRGTELNCPPCSTPLLPSTFQAPISIHSNQHSQLHQTANSEKVSSATLSDNVATVSPVPASSHAQLGHPSAIGRSRQGECGVHESSESQDGPGRLGDFRPKGRLHLSSRAGRANGPISSRGSLKRRTRPPVLLPDLRPSQRPLRVRERVAEYKYRVCRTDVAASTRILFHQL